MLLPFLLVTSGLRFRGIGDFYLGEVYSTFFFFINVISKKSTISRGAFPKGLRIGFGLWFGCIAFSSLISQSSVRSSTIACLSIFISFTLLYSFLHVFQLGKGKTRNLQYLLLGQTLAAIAQPYNFGITNGWKFQYGLPLSVLVISLIITRSRKIGIIVIFVFGFLSFNYSARNLAIAITLTGLICIWQELVNRRDVIYGMKLNSFIILLLIFFSSFIYFSLATSGTLGEREQLRIHKLLSNDQFLISSRPEIFFTSRALLESPLLGYGSSLDIDKNELLQIATDARDSGLVFQGLVNSAYALPVHSYIMDSMLKGGLLAGFFWFWCFIMGVSSLVRNLLLLSPPETILLLSLLWNIWFSPYGASSRILSMCAVFYIIQLMPRFPKANHSHN